VHTSDAQATALLDGVSLPGVPNDLLRMVGPSMPGDVFVFAQPYIVVGTIGGLVAVSARLGRTVFAASSVGDGWGEILLPADWREPSELGDGCGAGGEIAQARGYELDASTVVDPPVVARVVAAVERTVLPAALAQGGSVFDAVVIPYERNAAEHTDENAEWLVVVSGGSAD
jgi:hypothetical protein